MSKMKKKKYKELLESLKGLHVQFVFENGLCQIITTNNSIANHFIYQHGSIKGILAEVADDYLIINQQNGVCVVVSQDKVVLNLLPSQP